MPRKKAKQNDMLLEEDHFDITEMLGYNPDEDMMVGMMSGMIEASRDQLRLALDLTQLIVSKNPETSLSESEILSIFSRATQTIRTHSPIREFWEKVGA